MPVQGFARNRSWAFGKQSAHGTAVAPSRAVPFQGVLDVNPNWTTPEGVDMGSIDPILSPYRTQLDVTASLTGPASYREIPLVFGAGVRGGVAATGGGANKTWTQAGLSTTATTLDEFSVQWGDDVTSDGFRGWDGIVEQFELSFDDSLGPWQLASTWRFGSANPRVVPVSGLLVSSNSPWIFGADTALYIDSTSAAIGGTQISDAVRSMSIGVTNTIDVKRYANGSNTRFAVSGYGLSGREITASFQFDKASAITSSTGELAQWLSADPVTRYLSVAAISTVNIPGTSTPFSTTINLSGEWRTRVDGEVGGNSVVTLELMGRYDSGLGYPIRAVTVNDLATLP